MNGSIFFWSWPIWAKLGFVLGGCLVLVLVLAGLVKIRGIFTIQKLAETGRSDIEKAQIKQELRSSDEIAFGDKAMIEDPEVDGLWNSRASTPLQSPVLAPHGSGLSRLSFNLFSRSRRNSSVSSLTNLKLPEPTTPPPAPSDHPSPLPTGISAASIVGTALPRRRSVTIRAFSTQDTVPSTSFYGNDSSRSSNEETNRRSRVSTDPGPATPIHERRGRLLVIAGPPIDGLTLERTPTTKKALDRMEAHRKFHAAESGQLQPRQRVVTEKISRHKHSGSDNISLGHDVPRAVSWPITPGEAFIVDFNGLQKVQTMKTPDIVPLRAFIEMHPSSKAPPSAWTDKTQGMLDEKLEAQQGSKRRITIKNDNSSIPTQQLHDITNSEAIKNAEAVSLLGTQQRKINKGFEILPAGTFQDQSFAKRSENSKISLEEASNGMVRSKKLQKRNRSSSGSRHNAVETIPRIAV